MYIKPTRRSQGYSNATVHWSERVSAVGRSLTCAWRCGTSHVRRRGRVGWRLLPAQLSTSRVVCCVCGYIIIHTLYCLLVGRVKFSTMRVLSFTIVLVERTSVKPRYTAYATHLFSVSFIVSPPPPIHRLGANRDF